MSQSGDSAEESGLPHRLRRREPAARSPFFLLIGPYDPDCGEYTFLAPPLGVWRLAGVLESAGYDVEVFDPNCSNSRNVLELGPFDCPRLKATAIAAGAQA